MASLKGVYAVVGGVRYEAEDFLEPSEVLTVETGNGVTVVEMENGDEYHFTDSTLKRRKAGGNQIPRAFKPKNKGTAQKKEEKIIMATNMNIERFG